MNLEISISTLKKIGWITLLVILLSVSGFFAYRTFFPRQEPPVEPVIANGQEAALQGVQEFLSVDFTNGKQAWIDQVCAVSTTDGCQAMNNLAGMMWAGIENKKSRMEYTPENVTFIREIAGEDGRMLQVFKVTGALVDLNTTRTTSGEMHVIVEQVGNDWSFQRVLFEQEVQLLQTEMISTATAEAQQTREPQP
jgi:hypothetical protein